MSVSMLCVGDVHLGRAARLPQAVVDMACRRPAELGPAAAWRRAVARALACRVDAVLLAGDVVDQSNRFYESVGPLEHGVRELVDAGIRVCAVAGNHDVDVLPRLADEIDGFHLLGRGGAWAAEPIGVDGVRVLGWSFGDARVCESPMRSLARLADTLEGEGPLIGLLHCDLGAARSAHAPVQASDLLGTPAAAWLLGHIHAPSIDASAARPVGYLGSLVGLDPTEMGAHGPWLLRADGPAVRLEQQSVGPLRWERVEVPVDDLTSADDLDTLVVRSLARLHERIAPSLGEADVVGCRVYLQGRSRCFRELVRAAGALPLTDLVRPLGRALYFVDQVACTHALPAADLESIARGNDPPAALAALLLALERGEDRGMDLLRRAAPALQAEADRPGWAPAGSVDLDTDAARNLVLRAGRSMLEEMLAQRPAARTYDPDAEGRR